MPAAPTIVFAGGDPGSFTFLRTVDYKGAYLAAVDRGLSVAVTLGLVPDLFVGDGDSVAPELLATLDRDRTAVIMLPARKDISDLEATFDQLVASGRAGGVLVLAGLGGRLDHTLFNLQVAARHLDDFGQVTFEDDQCLVRPLMHHNDLQLPRGTTVSFVPDSAKVEVSLEGFAYPLVHAIVEQGSTQLLSNVVRESRQCVDVHRGTVFMIAWKHEVELSHVR
ncbi:thiamine diphosphokinase [bacterium]|nr:thiamine diphosphokinase [bacterium]